MEYKVSFTLFLDSDNESESDVKNLIKDQLDSAGASVDNLIVELTKKEEE